MIAIQIPKVCVSNPYMKFCWLLIDNTSTTLLVQLLLIQPLILQLSVPLI